MTTTTKLNNLTVKELKDIIRLYNLQTKITMSKRKKMELIADLDKHIYFDGDKIMIKSILVQENIIIPPAKTQQEENQLSFIELKFKYRNHPAMKLHEQIGDITKHLERNDYESKEDIKKAKAELQNLINIRDSDDMYILGSNGLPKIFI
jgi:hypothetical protein